MRILKSVILPLLLSLSASAYDIESGRQSGMGGCVLLSTPTASGFLSCPVAFLEKKRINVESGYQRKFELSDLDKIFISGGYRFGNFSTAIGISQFGRKDYYIEHVVRSAVTYNQDKFAGSVIMSGRLLNISGALGKLSLSAFSLGLAGGVHYKKYHLGIVIDNFNQPKLYDTDEKQNILYNIYGEVEGSDRFSITAHLSMERYEKPIISIGQYIRLAGQHALFWGVSNNPLTYGGGVEVHFYDFGLIYATSYHPVLGFTHNVSLNYKRGL